MASFLLFFLLSQAPCPGSAPCGLVAYVSVVHKATLYYQSTACTSTQPCRLTVYRNTCSSPTSCPNFNNGNGNGWITLTSGAGSATPTASGTTWVVIDSDPALKDSTTYIYYGRLAWDSAPTQLSAAGAKWVGTTSGPTSPMAPTVGAGNSVQ